jgi:hypothetical protein
MSQSHIFTVASGFGLRVVPKTAPYRFSLSPTPPGIDVERAVGGRWLFARVVPEQGGYRSQLDEHTPALAEVADVGAGPDWDRWWAETSHYRIPLLPGWTLQAADEPNAPGVFDLLGPLGMLIYLQTPAHPPALTEVAAPGQQVVASGDGPRSQWVELRYVHVGEPWAQRHHLMRIGSRNLVVTAQSHVSHMPVALRAQEALVAAVVPAGEA